MDLDHTWAFTSCFEDLEIEGWSLGKAENSWHRASLACNPHPSSFSRPAGFTLSFFLHQKLFFFSHRWKTVQLAFVATNPTANTGQPLFLLFPSQASFFFFFFLSSGRFNCCGCTKPHRSNWKPTTTLFSSLIPAFTLRTFICWMSSEKKSPQTSISWLTSAHFSPSVSSNDRSSLPLFFFPVHFEQKKVEEEKKTICSETSVVCMIPTSWILLEMNLSVCSSVIRAQTMKRWDKVPRAINPNASNYSSQSSRSEIG